jgi:hypothetical protein
LFSRTAGKRLSASVLSAPRCVEDSGDVPPPDELVQEIADDLQTAWEQFASIVEKGKG